MPSFAVQPEWHDMEDMSDACVLKAIDAEAAAKEYVRLNWSNLDYADDVQVIVRDAKGTMTRWLVFAEQDVHFRARHLEMETK